MKISLTDQAELELVEGAAYYAREANPAAETRLLAGTLVIRRRLQSNKSIDTDVLSAGFTGLLSAGHLRR